jgi:hypothetical protein
MLGLWRIAVTFFIGTAIVGALVSVGLACAAIPLGIAWDVLQWVISDHWPHGIAGPERIMRSHFVWGVCIGAGAAIVWHKTTGNDWREIANHPLSMLLSGKVTTERDRS